MTTSTDASPSPVRRVTRWRRPLAASIIAVALAIPYTVDRLVKRTSPGSTPSIANVVPSATPLTAGTSTWFCAGGRTENGKSDLTVAVANPTDVDVPGRITWFASEPSKTPVPVAVLASAHRRFEASAPDNGATGATAALIEFDGGGIVVDHHVRGPLGGANALCASSAATRWISADGATTVDAKTVLSVFNPFPEDALLDVRFATDRGTAVPAALQGISVAGRTVQEINVGDYVRRRKRVSAIVRARIGRVVVERITTFDGSGPAKGMTISPAASALSPRWYFASGRTTTALREHYVLFNPNRTSVTAQVDVVVDGAAGTEPFELELPPMQSAVLTPGDESRIPRDVGYSVVATTTNGQGIVVERTLDARGKLRRGYASDLGLVVPATSWLLADVTTTSARNDSLSILNPTDTTASVTIRKLGTNGLEAVPSLTKVSVLASSRLDIRLSDYVALDSDALVVDAVDAPIVVERSTQRVDTPGGRPVPKPLPNVSASLIKTAPSPRIGAAALGTSLHGAVPVR